MLSLRVKLLVLALVATPFVAGVAQGRGNSKPKPRSNSLAADESSCNESQAAAVARARAEGRPVPPGLDKKNCESVPVPPAPVPPPPIVVPPAPVPPPSSPPSGINYANGIVFEDLDGNGVRDPFAGEMGLAGWTVDLWWNGQVLASAITDVDGSYLFPNLGNTTYSLCVQVQAGYTQTIPVGGTGCGGSGYQFTFSGVFQQMFPGVFGAKLP